MNNLELAIEWRQKWGFTDKGGVIVIFKGEVDGWVDKLRDPQHWRAGCIAVDEAGNEWVAVGGNYHDGAERWQPNSKDGEVRRSGEGKTIRVTDSIRKAYYNKDGMITLAGISMSDNIWFIADEIGWYRDLVVDEVMEQLGKTREEAEELTDWVFEIYPDNVCDEEV